MQLDGPNPNWILSDLDQRRRARRTANDARKEGSVDVQLETGAAVEAHDLNEEHFADEIEPIDYSALRKARKTATSKPVKGMDPLCSI